MFRVSTYYREILLIILSYNCSTANTTLLLVIRNFSFGAISSLVSMSFFPGMLSMMCDRIGWKIVSVCSLPRLSLMITFAMEVTGHFESFESALHFVHLPIMSLMISWVADLTLSIVCQRENRVNFAINIWRTTFVIGIFEDFSNVINCILWRNWGHGQKLLICILPHPRRACLASVVSDALLCWSALSWSRRACFASIVRSCRLALSLGV